MVSIADNDQEKLTRRRPGADPLAPLCTANPERGSGVGSGPGSAGVARAL